MTCAVVDASAFNDLRKTIDRAAALEARLSRLVNRLERGASALDSDPPNAYHAPREHSEHETKTNTVPDYAADLEET